VKSFLLLFKNLNDFRLLIFGIILIFAFMISFGNINNILATSATDGKDYDSKEVKDNVRH